MIAQRYRALAASKQTGIRNALRLYQLGRLRWALDEFERESSLKDDPDGAVLFKHLQRLQIKWAAQGGTQLVWAIPSTTWETDWLRTLLRGAFDRELDHPGGLGKVQPGATIIIVDNQLDESKYKAYQELFEAGVKIALVHLSDEHYNDNLECYDWCEIVYRNYWSPVLREFSRVHFFPLGYKSGLSAIQTPTPASERRYLWSFAGDVSKSERRAMLQSLEAIKGGHLHQTSGFNAHDALDTALYGKLLGDTVYAPCPAGWVNVETFRIWEALECGAIPIIETRESSYIDELVGPHPLPTLRSWAEAANKMSQEADVIDRLQQECSAWWEEYKLQLSRGMVFRISSALFPRTL